MAEDTPNVAEEVRPEEVVTPQEVAPTEAPEVSEPKVQSDKDKNFIRMRETKEQLERENRELRQKMQQSQEDLGIDDDDIVEGRVIKKLSKQIRDLESAHHKERLSVIPERLSNKFSDFDQVVTQENVKKLEQSEPELYASITSGNDLYAKGVSVYKTLKAMGIVPPENYQSQKDKVQANQTRPVSAQAIRGQGALSEANIFAKGLTPELKKQLQKEMTEAAKAR